MAATESYRCFKNSIVLVALLGCWLGLTSEASSQQKLYWSDMALDEIHRCNLDGSEVQVVAIGRKIPLMTGMLGVTVDPVSGQLYWTDIGSAEIVRANLDGSNPRVVIAGEPPGRQLAVDPKHRKLYWTGGGRINRASLDGSEHEVIFEAEGTTAGIAIDTVEDKVYWTDTGLRDRIRRANLDGTNMEDIVTHPEVDLPRPEGLAIDTKRRKVYWSDRSRIRRANLDGTEVEDVLSIGIGNAWGVAVDPDAAKLFWADSYTRTIKRSNLDGSAVETLVSQYLAWPFQIALDLRPHLDRVIIEAPADGEVQVSMNPWLSWHALSGAAGYVVQVFRDTVLSLQVLSDTTTETSVSFTVPEAGADYFWRVRGLQPGESGPWSEVRRLTIRGELEAVSLLAPEDGAGGLSALPVFGWTGPPGASRYRLQIAREVSFEELVVSDSTISGTAFKLDDPLEYSTRYYWRVSAGDNFGWSAWSVPRYFETGAGVASEMPPEIAGVGIDVYPNPTRVFSTITVEAPTSINASITVWDVRGRLVGRVYDGPIAPGVSRYRWSCSLLPPGLYLVRLEMPGGSRLVVVVVL